MIKVPQQGGCLATRQQKKKKKKGEDDAPPEIFQRLFPEDKLWPFDLQARHGVSLEANSSTGNSLKSCTFFLTVNNQLLGKQDLKFSNFSPFSFKGKLLKTKVTTV